MQKHNEDLKKQDPYVSQASKIRNFWTRYTSTPTWWAPLGVLILVLIYGIKVVFNGFSL